LGALIRSDYGRIRRAKVVEKVRGTLGKYPDVRVWGETKSVSELALRYSA